MTTESLKSPNTNGNGADSAPLPERGSAPLHRAWEDFIRYCRELQFGELEKLKIQNGVPMMAELATRKIKFGPPS